MAKKSATDAKTGENRGIVIKGWGVLIIAVIIFGLGFLFCLLLRSPGCATAPAAPDTITLIEYDTSGVPVIPDDGGEAIPTIDSIWVYDSTGYPLPWWSIQLVDFRNSTLKLSAVRPRDDSVEVYSATYYAPGGFTIWEDHGRIRVDTFTFTPQPEIKKDWWQWYIEAGVCYALDSLRFRVRPLASAGGQAGPLNLGRVSISFVPLEVSLAWGIGGKCAPIIGSKVRVEF